MSEFDLFDDDEYDFSNTDNASLNDLVGSDEKPFQAVQLPHATIFLVDCHAGMQQILPEVKPELSVASQKTLISRVVEVISEGLKINIISRPNDLVSIIFYNTYETGTGDFPGVEVFSPFQGLSAAFIRDISSLPLLLSSKFRGSPNPKGSCSLADALWACSQAFSSISRKDSYSKQVCLFTANDDPSYGNSSTAIRICERFEDLSSSSVSFELFSFAPIVTDRPISNSQTSQNPSQNELVPNNRLTNTRPFDNDTFFSKILELDSDDSPLSTRVITSQQNSFDNLLERFKKKLSPSRSYATVPILIGSYSTTDAAPTMGSVPAQGLASIGVNIYTTNVGVTIPTAKYSKNQVALTSSSVQLRKSTGDRVFPHQIRKYFTLGAASKADPLTAANEGESDMSSSAVPYSNEHWDNKVRFTPADLASLKHFGTPGIRVICSKPISWVIPTAVIASPYFLHPNEFEYPGSARAYSALFHGLMKTKKILLCHVIIKASMTPVLCALVPSDATDFADSKDKSNIKTGMPSYRMRGLYLVPIPYANDVRDVNFPPASSSVSTAMKDQEILSDAISYIRALSIGSRQSSRPISQVKAEANVATQEPELEKVNFPSFPDPKLQKERSILAALALHTVANAFQDPLCMTRAQALSIAPLAQKFLDRIAQMVPEDVGTKRKAASTSTTSAKRANTGSDALSLDDMLTHYKSKTLGKLLVKDLSAFLSSVNLPHSGKKAELVERAEMYLKNK